MKLERAMNSEHEAEAVRLAETCAATLLDYYAAERSRSRIEISRTWFEHQDACNRFADTFPGIVGWMERVPAAVLAQIEEARP